MVATEGGGDRTRVRSPQGLGDLSGGQAEVCGLCPVKRDHVFRCARLTTVRDVDQATSLAELADDLIGQIVENFEVVAIHTEADGLRGSASRAWHAGTNL